MALTKNCWSNAGKVSWRRTTYHGVPDQDHAPSNSPKNIMGEKGIKERGISEESCVKRNVPTFPGRRRDSDAVRNERHGRRLYISAVCLESPARYYKILRIFLKPQPASFVPPSLPLPVQSGNRRDRPLKTQTATGFLLPVGDGETIPGKRKAADARSRFVIFFRIAVDFYAI